jgi:hypothetical protein
MGLTAGSQFPLKPSSPLAHASQASCVVTPEAHAAKDATEKLTTWLSTVNLFRNAAKYRLVRT